MHRRRLGRHRCYRNIHSTHHEVPPCFPSRSVFRVGTGGEGAGLRCPISEPLAYAGRVSPSCQQEAALSEDMSAPQGLGNQRR